MVGTEWARRDEDVGVGFTSIGVTSEKLWPGEVHRPICKNNLYKQAPELKTENVFSENTSLERRKRIFG